MMISKPFSLDLLKTTALLIGASLALIVGCDTTDSEAREPVDTTIQIVSPNAAASFKMSEGLTMIVKCDYSKFTSGLNYQASIDSAKTWLLIKSLPRKEGIALDTLVWDPLFDPPGEIPLGKPVLIRIIDYDKAYFTISKYFTFTN
jgi:hypothetical protein